VTPRNSKQQWRRLILAAGALALAFVSLTHSLAQTVLKTSPDAAAQLAPYDGRILSKASEALFVGASTPTERSRAASLARQAILKDPTSAEALIVLGLAAQITNRMDLAKPIFVRANLLTRREMQAHLWGIEEAVDRGDIATALYHYDLALRTSGSAQALLFPVLSAAIGNMEIRKALLPVLKAGPHWRENFVGYAVLARIDLTAINILMAEMQREGMPVDRRQRASLTDALLRAGNSDMAWQLFAALRPGSSRAQVRAFHENDTSDQPTLFDWHVSEIADGSVSLSGGAGGELTIFGSPPLDKPIIEQWQALAPGTYRLTLAMPAGARGASVSLQCHNGPTLAVISYGSPASPVFEVPTSCPVQVLSISVKGDSGDMEGSGIRIGRATIQPVGAD